MAPTPPILAKLEANPVHSTKTVRNKQENLEGKAEVIFDTLFIAQSQAESMCKIMGAVCEGRHK